jgi:hypothetical protein
MTGRSRALKAGEDAIGVPVLAELYDQMKATPLTPDLSALWHELGFDLPAIQSCSINRAHALVVRSIMARRSEPHAAHEHTNGP